jgi:hypothetical protein
MSNESLERGYWRAYRDFYRWGSILRGSRAHDRLVDRVRHAAYAAGWKKFEPLWDAVIRAKQTAAMLPVLEGILSGFGARATERAPRAAAVPLPSSVDPRLTQLTRIRVE